MIRKLLAFELVFGALIAFAFFVPVMRLDTNVAPRCVAERIPCPLTVHTQLTDRGVYWSITAYYLGIGTYLVPFTDYGLLL
jgi:hypothetical protein